MVGAAECTLTVGADGCTLTTRASGRSLAGVGDVLGLCPCGLRYTLVAWALPLQFMLCACGLDFALTTIKWIHVLQFKEFISFALQKIYEFNNSTNSYLHEFIYLNHWIHRKNKFVNCMNSYVLKQKHINFSIGSKLANHTAYTLPHHHDLPGNSVFLQFLYYLYYMILMSKKMTSQNKLYEFKSVP